MVDSTRSAYGVVSTGHSAETFLFELTVLILRTDNVFHQGIGIHTSSVVKLFHVSLQRGDAK